MAQLFAGTSGFAYAAWKPGILPAKGRVEGLLEVLRRAAECGRDQLHVPPIAQGRDARKLGERDARRLRVRLQSAHAHHAHRHESFRAAMRSLMALKGSG